ncbi:uncharacterized protein [Littorina saxatilis]|uniref:uncharacterized protein n=1 Tax=Littorina saxatilis TaxID=31220 RepID=UPI0038B66E5F
MSEHTSRSKVPSQSIHSVSTSLSCIAARTRARARAAQVKAQYARRKLELSKRQAAFEEETAITEARNCRKKKDWEAELTLLEAEEDAAAEEAEASVLEAWEGGSTPAHSPPMSPPPSVAPSQRLPTSAGPSPLPSHANFDAQSRTQQYVNSLPNDTESKVSKHRDDYTSDDFTSVHSSARFINNNNNSNNSNNSNAKFNRSSSYNCNHPHEELSKFLLKKDLLLNRLSVFNEEPGAFPAWKISFKSVMVELGTTPQEELDLLVKYLGPESGRYARSMQSSSAGNPRNGLQLLWERLEERFGSPELIEAHLKAKIHAFPPVTKDNRKLFDLCDLMDEIYAAKENPSLMLLFSIYDTSSGANLIVEKLPHFLKQKWISVAANYKSQHKVAFPPFSVLLKFVRDMSKIYNDPAFQLDNPVKNNHHVDVRTRMSGIIADNSDVSKVCPIHKTQHQLPVCKKFASMTFEEKRSLLKEKNLCYRCLLPDHAVKQCKATVKCEKCGKGHLTVMHRMSAYDPANRSPPADQSSFPFRSSHGGENTSVNVNNRCTALCGSIDASRSCGKIVPVRIFSPSQPSKSMQVYAVIDDQSNRSLASPALLDGLGVSSDELVYTLTSCSGSYSMSGRRVSGLCVQSLDAQTTLNLPSLIECDKIPEERSEIPTPEVAQCHAHLQRLAAVIPPSDARLPIGILIGRDLPEAHHVLDQIIGPPSSPFALRLRLGWVIIGDVCLQHKSTSVNTKKTSVDQGHDSVFEPCRNHIKLCEVDEIAPDLFKRTSEDETVAMSIEDKRFLSVMDNHFQKNSQENTPVTQYLSKSRIKWKFNPPHASHMGGSWERIIGVVRRVLDALLLDAKQKTLTHELPQFV